MGRTFPLPAGVQGDAAFSSESPPLYRHVLRRWWPVSQPGKHTKRLLVIGHNPSNAGKRFDDPTIFKVCKFALAWGFNDLLMHNLMNRIGEEPSDLLKLQPSGCRSVSNLQHVVHAAKNYADLILCAWGNVHPSLKMFEDEMVSALLSVPVRQPLHVLGLNETGSPQHPLYMPDNTILKLWKR